MQTARKALASDRFIRFSCVYEDHSQINNTKNFMQKKMIIMTKVMKSKVMMIIAKIGYLTSLIAGYFTNLCYYVNYCCYWM